MKKYRGVMIFGLMMFGSFVVISTISGLLELTMRRKAPVVVEAYTPPSVPLVARPNASGGRSLGLVRADRS